MTIVSHELPLTKEIVMYVSFLASCTAVLPAAHVAVQKCTVEALQGSGSVDGIPVVFEESCDMDERLSSEPPFNVIHPSNVASSDPGYALAAHFVSNLLPVGHIKSTKLDDRRFIDYFSASEKWLKVTTD